MTPTSSTPTIRAWQINVVLLCIGAGMFVLSHQLVQEYDHFIIGFAGVAGWSTAAGAAVRHAARGLADARRPL